MSSLTNEQLAELTALVNARLDEFDNLFDAVTPGVMRLVYDAIGDWEWEHEEERDLKYETLANPAHFPDLADQPDGVDVFPHLPIAGEADAATSDAGNPSGAPAAAPPKSDEKLTDAQTARLSLSPTAAATLGPEHTVVTPLRAVPRQVTQEVKRDADRIRTDTEARRSIAQTIAAGTNGDLAAKKSPYDHSMINQPRTLAKADVLDDVEDEADDEGEDMPTTKHEPSVARRRQLEEIKQQRRVERDKRTHPASKRGTVLPDLAALVKEVQRQAMGGVMPSQAVFNDARPANWATAAAHLLRLGISWDDLAKEAGLRQRGR